MSAWPRSVARHWPDARSNRATPPVRSPTARVSASGDRAIEYGTSGGRKTRGSAPPGSSLIPISEFQAVISSRPSRDNDAAILSVAGQEPKAAEVPPLAGRWTWNSSPWCRCRSLLRPGSGRRETRLGRKIFAGYWTRSLVSRPASTSQNANSVSRHTTSVPSGAKAKARRARSDVGPSWCSCGAKRSQSLDRPVRSGRRQRAAVGRHGHAAHAAHVSAQDVQLLAVRRVPDADRAVLAAGDQGAAVRCVSHAVDAIGVSEQVRAFFLPRRDPRG